MALKLPFPKLPFPKLRERLSGGSDKTAGEVYAGQEAGAQREAGLLGAAKGAGMGAALGSKLGAPGIAAGAIGGGIIGGITGAKRAQRSPTDKYQDERLSSLLDRAENLELGYSDAEMRQEQDRMREQARSSIQDRQAQAARAGMATPEFSGQYGELQRRLAGMEAAGEAERAAQVKQLSDQEAERQRAELDRQIRQREGREERSEAEAAARAEAFEGVVQDLYNSADFKEALLELAGISPEQMSDAEREAMVEEYNEYLRGERRHSAGGGRTTQYALGQRG